MSNQLPIQMLIELSQQELDVATQRLGRLQQECSEVARQLDSLIEYRGEYVAQFNASAQQGISGSNWRNFQAFIETLDMALDKQRGLLAQAQARLDAARPEWIIRKQKLGSFEILLARQNAQQQMRAARLEQRASDEHAAKVLRMRADIV
jgi:flagellar FliJ protein